MAHRRREGKICSRIKSGGVATPRAKVTHLSDRKKKLRIPAAPFKRSLAARRS